MYGLMADIVYNTTNRKALHFRQLREEYVSDSYEDLFAATLPSPLEFLSWQVTCDDEESGEALHRAVSGCSRSLRALSLVRSTDIAHFTGSQSINLEFLRHLKLTIWEGGLSRFATPPVTKVPPYRVYSTIGACCAWLPPVASCDGTRHQQWMRLTQRKETHRTVYCVCLDVATTAFAVIVRRRQSTSTHRSRKTAPARASEI